MSNEGNESGAPRRRAKMAAALVAVFVVGAIGGGALMMSTDAWSHWGRWGGMKGHHGDPAMWTERMRDRASRWLGKIDATDEQREVIDEIIGQAVDAFSGTIEEHRSLRREWLTEFERPELDAEAMEALRARHLELVDRKSRRALDTVIRIGSVLTAEQRANLLSELSRHRERSGRKES